MRDLNIINGESHTTIAATAIQFAFLLYGIYISNKIMSEASEIC